MKRRNRKPDPIDEAMQVALWGICAAPVCGVAMASGAIGGVAWLATAGGFGLICIALLAPCIFIVGVLDTFNDD